ncbi:MAG: hypothetical protein QM626_13870 [Microbacterium sp.]|uniref:hypothetical protein n=1 Tax=Microbacterium sp. TaxID=51671 RepID=UPI0039E50FB6
MNRARVVVAGMLVAVVLLLAACSGSRASLAQSATAVYAAGATVRLALQTDTGLFPTTQAALRDEMTQEAADAVSELETAAPDAADRGYRDAALQAARTVLDGIRLAAQDDTESAERSLDTGLDALAGLGAGG